MIRIRYIVMLILVALVMALPTAIQGRNQIPNPIVFVGNELQPPVMYKRGEAPVGIAVDLARELGQRMGHPVEIRALPWAEAQQQVLMGEAHALLHINPSPRREELYDFSTELLPSQFCIFKRAGDPTIWTLENLNGKRVGVDAWGYPYQMLSKREKVELVNIPNWKTAFDMLKNGTIDAVVVDRWIGEYGLQANKIKGIETVEQPIKTQQSRIAVKKGDSALLQIINDGLQSMEEDGTKARILQSWLSKDTLYITEADLKHTLSFALLTLFAILMVISWIIHRIRTMDKKREQIVLEEAEKLERTNEELREAVEELRRLAQIDGLTNIYNRRYFDNFLAKIWEISARESLPLALIMIDLDHFKKYNDTHGHLAGDRCLKQVAETIADTLKRAGDSAARFGGEEFVVVLPNTAEEGAATVAEQIRSKVEELPLQITLSLGVAAMTPVPGLNPTHLINMADRALYQAKAQGRNKVVAASPLTF